MSLSQQYLQPCEANAGGVRRLWLTNRDDVNTFTLTGEDYTAILMEAGKVFFKHEFEQESFIFTETGSKENNTFAFEDVLVFLLSKMDSDQRKAIMDMVDSSICGMIAIIEDTNNIKRVIGFSESLGKDFPLKITGDESTSGGLLTDANGSTITLTAKATEKARILANSVTIPV